MITEKENHVTHTDLNDAGVVHLLSKIPDPIQLTLEKNAIGEVGIKAIADFLICDKTLMSLDISRNNLQNEGIKTIIDALKKNNTLTELNIQYNEIDSTSAETIADLILNNHTLKALHIGGSLPRYDFEEGIFLSVRTIGNEGIVIIAKALEKNNTLTSFSMIDFGMSEEGAKSIAQMLIKNKTLTALNLRHNSAGDEGVQAIAKALEKNNTLRSLGLGYSSFSLKGTRAIAEVLRKNKTLTTLDLSGNATGPQGIIIIFDALCHNKTLTELNIENNTIGIDNNDIHQICTFLKENNSLTTLRMGSNEFESQNIARMFNALEQNKTLTSLGLKFERLDGQAAEAVADLLKTNDTLKTLDLSYVLLDANSMRVIIQSLKRNKTLTEFCARGGNFEEIKEEIIDMLQYNITLLNFQGIQDPRITALLLRNKKYSFCDQLFSNAMKPFEDIQAPDPFQHPDIYIRALNQAIEISEHIGFPKYHIWFSKAESAILLLEAKIAENKKDYCGAAAKYFGIKPGEPYYHMAQNSIIGLTRLEEKNMQDPYHLKHVRNMLCFVRSNHADHQLCKKTILARIAVSEQAEYLEKISRKNRK